MVDEYAWASPDMLAQAQMRSMTTIMSPTSKAPTDPGVFLRELTHPHKAAIEAIRAIILGADKRIQESVKWNSLSYHTVEHFATFHLRAKSGVQVVFHRGARVKDNSAGQLPIDDPAGLLTWLANDRATATFADVADVTAKAKALKKIVKQWITLL